ncbi:PAS domain S-box protein [Peribacillus cavernae]|uniref:histidine kinase n=1 Tax=Peribacillus cavernae TaxID=1674310 RepID=A0A3S0W403_9BACI|nr:ATP-binding protein [Peribacillus cavernae]MDQ0219829.1 PAS domain S-box-containing protein [Peribacillus cavernae]RUQ27220.1 PAS domain S-box protein [Peribacillus cavernae]
MLEKYKGRIISTSIFVGAVILWNSIYYGYYNYPINLPMDIIYTIFIAALVWWLSSYYDKSKLLLTNLSLSEEKYKKLSESTSYVFDNLNETVFQIDRHGNFTLLNPAWETLTGFTIKESLDNNIFLYVYPEDRSLITQQALTHFAKKTIAVKEEVRFRKKDGGFIWLELNAKLSYDVEGHFDSSVGTLTDIMDWITSERELLELNENLSIQSEKMAVVTQMSAAIAHEVRNPLTSISGFIQLLKEHKQLNEEYIDVVFSEIERIELVLSEMLVLSKPQILSFTKFDLAKAIDHVVALIRTEANMKSIELELHASSRPIWVFGEENRLKQVFINIIKNAIEAIDTGGNIQIYYAEDKEFVSVYIKDNGAGIPKDILNMIGQPFYTSKEKGTGLGLTICFKIIESHNGKIHITSESGIGTTFEVILPRYIEK